MIIPIIRTETRGFTLIELMIAVAVVGIVSAIAYPSYRDQVQKSRRSEAKSALLENVQFLERNFTANNCYHRTDGDCANGSVAINLPVTAVNDSTGKPRYAIRFAAGEPTPNSFILEAAPAGTMSGDACGTFTLNHLGAKGIKNKPSGSTKTAEECWQR
ncbi:type IV pilin protein [Methylocaldum sp. MU1018]